MYRVKAEAVSGKSVFADGKWLRCIGNKIVRAGDLVWTDGRCVYGNHKEAQQPLVITAPDNDTAIPILIGNKCYIFKGHKLTLIDQIDVSTSNLCFFNDTKGHAFVYDDNEIKIIANNEAEQLLAANIDKFGNVYYLTFLYNPKDNEESSTDVTLASLRIFKNNEVVFTVSLLPEIQKLRESVTEPPEIEWDSESTWYYRDSGAYNSVELIPNAFIENENNWFVWYEIGHIKWCGVFNAGYTLQMNTNRALKLNYISPKGTVEVESSTTESRGTPYFSPEPDTIQNAESYNSTTIILSDGYYCTLNPNSRYPFYRYGSENFWLEATFFSSTNQVIFTIFTILATTHAITRVKGGFLFVADRVFVYGSDSLPASLGAEYIYSSGIYLYKNNTFTLLAKGNRVGSGNHYVANRILRPMKKYKNWQNRIKEFSLPET